MSLPGWWQRFYWTRLAKPVEDRALFGYLLERPYRSVLEVGMGDGQRLRRLARLIQIPPDVDRIRYIGTDEFESAEDRQGHMRLKDAHRLAGQLGFRVALVPGPMESTMMRVAHKFGPSDLVIINGGWDPEHPHDCIAGRWLPHIAHEGSVILASKQPGATLQPLAIPAGYGQVPRPQAA